MTERTPFPPREGIDFGPIEVEVNGLKYVHEETLFAAMQHVDRLKDALQEIAKYPVGDDGYRDIAKAALDA